MKRRRGLLLTAMVGLAVCAACGAWLTVQRQQYARNRQLIDALTHGDTRTALALVNAGADPNTQAEPVPPPSFKLLLDQLLRRKNSPVNTSPTAFVCACGLNWNPATGAEMDWHTLDEDLPLLQAMLAHGANVHATTFDNSAPLHYAVAADRRRTVELLLKHGANPNAQNRWGKTPLMCSGANMTINVAHVLLANGANPNMPDANGDTALYCAVGYDNAKIMIPELLAHGADPNRRNKYGSTPLIMAQTANRPDLVRLLKRSAR